MKNAPRHTDPEQCLKAKSPTCNGISTAAAGIIPHAQQIHEEIATKLHREHLGDHVEVGHEGGLQDDGDVARVEQLDGVGAVLAAVPGRLDGQVHAEALLSTTKELSKIPDQRCGSGMFIPDPNFFYSGYRVKNFPDPHQRSEVF
jgi:hypothetical protein